VNKEAEMTFLFLLVIGVTSVSSYLGAVKWLGLSTGSLSTALGNMLDCIGTMLIFVVLNLALGAAVILGVRLVGGRFVSLYLLDDQAWLALSALQGLTWSLWRQRG
jgi:hypothetical protein